MADTFRRVVSDQATLGYRQLPSIGSEGPDLRTLVFAGLGVALGILVGTVMADGSWRQMNPLAKHPIVQASSSGSGSANPAATKAVLAPPVQAQSTTHGSPQPPAARQSAAIQALADGKASAVRAASVTHSASGTHNASAVRSASGTRRVSAAHRHRPVHGLAGWKRHFGRHKTLRRHRLRALRRAAISGALPDTGLAPKPVDMDTPFIFTVEGELTVSAYDALAGTIDTYEGETFALHNAASASSGIHGEDFSPNIHYKCDRFGSCTLIAGQFVLDAQRTK